MYIYIIHTYTYYMHAQYIADIAESRLTFV